MTTLTVMSRVLPERLVARVTDVAEWRRVAGIAIGAIPWRSAETTERGTLMPGVRVGSAVVVVDAQKRVLLGRRAKTPNFGRWVLPGGKVEAFEPIDVAGRREVLEETGLEIEIVQRLGVFEIIDPPNEHRLIVFSLATPRSGSIDARSDLTDVAFFAPEALTALDLTEVTVEVLKAAGVLETHPGLVPA